ncbi:YadA-like family protein [Burkholderia ambifaria]|uniref:YadA-like family protein n=1 Tax=Burkholderia ambifaria TaxID=152480 RepID=UPI001E30D4F3|nr:YadA-like family protein [Burkholderia ambifaria]UEP22957.1 YadA-like family protein [Burkholderia ambifaria]
MGSAYADEVDAADPVLDDPTHLTDVKQEDQKTLKRSGLDTRVVVPDNSAYVKINAKGDGTDNASATGDNSIAIGASASTRPATSGLGGAVAIGNKATAAGNNVAFGANASALGEEGAIALGTGANAGGKSSIALGNEAQATGWGAYALGRKAKATAESSLAIGDSSMATRAGTMAIGSQAAAAAENAIAIGQSAAARGADSLALGSYSEADRDNTVSVGTAGFERQIVNVGRGTQATDAVNIAQLKDVTATLGGNAAVDATGNIKKPAYTIGTKTYDNVGDALLAASESGGGSANAVEYDSTTKNSVTLGGTGSAAVKLTNVRAATLAANSTDAVNGAQLFATNNRVTNVEQSLKDSGVIDPSTGESLAVVYNDATKSTVALGGTGGTVVTNVKAGKVASASKDAVNGGQLYDVSSSVASALGGQTTVNTDGTLSKPTYKVGDKTFNNVGDALQAAAASGGGAGGEDANAVHYDGAGKTSVTLGGAGASNPVSLKNVATGQAATDAVNVAQLQSGMSDVKDEIKKDLGDGTLNMKYIKVNAAGMQANALGKNSVAIGSQANATNVDTLAIGSGARASGMNSIAIGVNSVAADANTVSIGDVGATRRIVNVSDGVDDTDAVNMKQLTNVMHSANTKLDAKMTRMVRDVESKPGSFVAVEGLGADGSSPNIASMNGRDPTMGTAAAIGVASGAGGLNAIAVGLQAVASSDHSVAIGSIAQTGVDQPYSVAMGSMVTTNGAGALAIGSRAKANADNAVAVGNNGVAAVGKSSIAIGDKAMTAAGTVNSVAMGKSANVAQNVTDAIALGANASVASGNNGGIALGANSVADRGNALSVGSNSLQRQIVNVAKGTKNNDAVNVSQLTGVTNALGGGAAIGTDGNITAPTYKVGDTTYNNVGDALDAMAKNGGSDPNAVSYDSATKDKVTLAGGATGTTLSNVKAGTADMDAVNVSQLKSSGLIGEDGKSLAAITYDKNTDGTPNYKSATLAGDGGTTLTNVKAGALSATSTDAVNGSQLFATNENLGNLKDTLTDGGVIDKTTGESLAVVYDSTTKDKVTLAGGKTGTTLSNVKAGTADMDAVNVSQLKSSGLVGEDGKSRAAITYDKNTDGTTNYKSATLAGEGGTTLTNVKAGALSATSTDAVNGSQLFATNENLGNLKDTLTDGGVIDKTTGESLAVVYDSTTKDKVTLAGGKTGTTLSNVKAGTADMDAVNVSQLKSSGLIDGDGKSIAAVTYDKKTDGTPNYNSVTLGGGKSTGPVTLSNVAQGKANTDAVNVEQLTKAISDVEGGMNPLAVSYDSVTKDKVTLAGGTTGTTLTNVKAGTADMDAVNVSQLKSSGLVGEDGKSLAAITYDKNTDGTPNYKSATLAGDGGTTLTNVKAGALSATSTDAVNGSQLFATNENLGNLKDTLTDGGVIDKTTGESLAVVYDSTTKDKVTLAGGTTGTTLSNVKAGTADMDAVNVSQLKSSGLVGEDGKSRAAVTYDKNTDGTPNYKSATLAGEGGTTLTNVKAGALSATSTDAVNGSQLFATNENLGNLKDTLTDGGVIDKTTGESLAVVYDSTTKDKVTLAGGKTGTTLSNVKAGTADLDAVNVSQLKSSGLIDGDGKSIAAVTYDKKTDGTPNYNSVTLGRGKSTGPVTLSNVAQGKAGTDAVNVDQLTKAIGDVEGGMNPLAVSYDSVTKDKVTLAGGTTGTTLTNVAAGKVSADSKDAVNGSQLHGTAQSVADALGGGSAVDENGKLKAPTYTLADPADDTKKVDYHTVGDALENLDGRVASNTGDITHIKNQFTNTGLVDADGDTRAAVTYDKNKDGTPNYQSATLAGKGGTKLTNVAAGTADLDAVNVSQLKSSGLVGEDGKSRAAITYDKNTDGTPNYKSATLAGEGGTTLTNVKAGALSATSTDAVNGSQLFATNENLGNLKDTLTDGGVIDKTTGESLAVVYDSTTKDKVTLAGGKTGTTLSNVKAGTADMDAVNVSQLKSSGLIDGDGKSIAAVTYDKKTDGTPNYNSVTLGGGKSTGPVTLSNVAQGKANTDAVNVEQLTKAISDVEGGMNPLAVSYDSVTKDKVTLAGGTTGTTLTNVKAGTADMDAVNVSQLKSSGLVGEDGKSLAAITYDKNTDGTPNYKSATLAGEGGTTLTNVKAGALSATSTDAVNGSQLFATNENLGNLKDTLTDGGVIDKTTGESLAVVYDSTTKDKVTLAGKTGTTLSNVKAGTADMDAVNVSQLKSSGLVGEDGKSRAAVTYDKNTDGTPNYKSATLAGEGGTTLTNVKAGALSATSTDAVNGSQLFATNENLGNLKDTLTDGGVIDKTTGESLAVVYDSTTKDKVTLAGGKTGTTLSNVKAGTADLDAVNVSQLKSSGLIDGDGKSIAAVTYDKKTDGTPNYNSVTLGGGKSTGPVTLSNVAKGKVGTDAVNVDQLTDALRDVEGGLNPLAVAYDTVKKDKVTLAGEGGTTLSNVKAGTKDMDAVNVSQLKSSGLVDGDGKSRAAITYDKNADGTPNYKSATLAGVGGTKLSNVADGKEDKDAVNVSQLKSTGLIGEDGKTLAAVTYDKNADGTPNYKSATLAGEGGTTLSNVKAGTKDMDAVNVSQLKSSGLVDGDGKSRAAITYDKNADGTPKYTSATLAGVGGTKLSNVADGKEDKDAVNVSQLKSTGLIGEDGKTLAAVTYDKNADGTPNYKSATLAGEGGTTLSNVKAGTKDMDAVNVSQLKSSGLVDGDGKSRAAITYDKNADGTPNYKSATLAGVGGTKLSNVADGKEDKDAVNVSQLKSTGLIGEDGKSRAAVTYDKNADGTPKYTSATLAGEGGTTLSNVKAGTKDMDAVNVSQLKSSGLVDGDGKSRAAITYDKNADGTPKYTSATLAGVGGTKLSNVADGKEDKDAVNVSQLKSTGLIGEDGKSLAAVTYDKNKDGTANHESVTLAGKAGTKLTNVKAAELSATSMDAVNGSQLFATNESLGNLKDALTDGGVIDEKTGESLAVVYDSTSKDKVTLAGGKTGTTLSNVKAGTADMDAVNVSQLKSSGLIDGDGKSIAAVTYDRNTDGTPNYNSVTLGGGKSTGPVTLSNVAQGKAGTDAVNVDQLNNLEDSLVNGAVKLKYIKVNSEGREAIARGPESVAIGANAWATRPQAMALGSGSRANGVNSVAIGYNSVADDDNTVAVGNVGEERRVVHLAAGVDDTDAVNMRQLTDAMHSANTKLDAKMTRMVRDVESKPGSFVAIDGLGADGSMTNIASMNGRNPNMGTAAAIGVGSGASGINSIAVGLQAVSNSDHSVAIGSIAQTGVDQPYAVAMGSMVTTNGAGALAIGSRAKANADNAVAVGNNGVVAVGKSSIAIGDKAMTNAGTVNSIAIGTNANVQQNVADAIALGANSQALSSNSVALGANSIANRANALSIGKAGAERQIVNVAKGTQDTDAVSLAQLKGLADVVGGGTGFDKNGDVTAPTYTIDGKEYHNVNDALQAAAKSGGDGSSGTDPNAVAYDGELKDKVTLAGQNGTTLSNVAAGKADTDAVNVSQLKSSGLIDKDGNAAAALTYDKNEDGTPNFTSATLAGDGGTTLTNVKAGALSATSTDAVNGSQLFATNENLGNLKDSLTDGGVIDKTTGESLAVVYDSTSKDKLTLAGGQTGTTLSNVKAGTADMDAVNVSQLKSSGLIGENGKALAAVTYDTHTDGTTNFASVTFGGMNAGVPVALHNVAAGKVSTDAVNVSQLKGVTDIIGGGAGIDADGKVTSPVYNVDGKDYVSVGDAIKALEQREGGTGNGTNPNAVAYDDATKAAVTLAGEKGTVLRNVADGSLAEFSTEAVNGGQVNFLASSIADSLGGGAKFDPVTGDISAPTYELTAADGLTNTYDNVGDAFKHVDERVSTHTKQIDTLEKGVANAVQYDDATHAAVTFGGAGAAPVMLKNVADGVDETDAVNVRQLRSAGLVGEDGKLQSAVVYDKNADGTTNYGSVTLGGVGAATPVALHNVAAGKAATDAVNVSQLSGVTDALGGGAKIDEETGKVVAPTYDVGGNTFHNAGDALTNIDNRVTQIQDNLGEATKLVGAVAYDKNGDGTVNFNTVTLGNGLSTGPVVLTNVADGKSQYDAVNYGQFSKLEGRVSNIDERLNTVTTPGGNNSGNDGESGSNLIGGTGGSGKDSAEIVAAKPGNGNGNIAVGSGSQIVDGKNNAAAIGAGSKVSADNGTALGQGASVSSGADNSVALGQGSQATEANTVSVGSDGHERRIVNVADGVKATDAVSKGQFDRALGGMQGQINDISRNAYSGIAAATALTMIPGVDPGKTLSFGIGGGSYKGYQAVALGGEARITENLKMRAGVGLSSGGNTYGVGASYQW